MMREWSVKLEYRDAESCRVTGTVYAEQVPGDSEEDAIAGAISQAREQRGGNLVDGSFYAVWARPLLRLGESVAVAAGILVDSVSSGFIYAGEHIDLAFEPPVHGVVAGFYLGMPGSEGGAFVMLDNGVAAFCPPDGKSAWPEDPEGFRRDRA